MKELTVLCPAKINLTLDVLGQNGDGYHEIKSVMQTVSLYDTVTVAIGGAYISLQSDLRYVPKDRRNTAYKAAEAFFRQVGATYGVRIFIKKRIPVSAGLAGGSADAAGVVFALNRIFGSPLSKAELNGLCRSVGADVPFCLEGGTKLATGVGEKLTALQDMPACRIVIVKPQGGLSTSDIYRAYDAAPRSPSPDTAGAIRALEKRDLEALCKAMGNVFEEVAKKALPQVSEAVSDLSSFSPLKTLMSGSGSSVFAVFKDENAASRCLEAVKDKYGSAFLVSPSGSGVKELRRENDFS